MAVNITCLEILRTLFKFVILWVYQSDQVYNEYAIIRGFIHQFNNITKRKEISFKIEKKRGEMDKLNRIAYDSYKENYQDLWAICQENYKAVLGYIKQDEQIKIYTMLLYWKKNFTK